jgi:predicted transposase/invertase (TIGR01784 family)
MKFADPKSDIAFKKIFGDASRPLALIDLLNTVLELPAPVAQVQILTPYQAPRLKGLKESVLDIRAQDREGHHYIIEMQMEKDHAFAKRVLYYSSKAYVSQIDKAEDYKKLHPVIFLGILDFSIFNSVSPVTRHLILNQENQNRDLKDFEFNFIELGKFTKRFEELSSVQDHWLYFFKHAGDFSMIPANLPTEGLKQAYETANQHEWSLEEREVYDYWSMQEGIHQSALDTARKEGMLEQQKKIVLQARQLGLSDGQFAELVGLDKEQVITLLEKS